MAVNGECLSSPAADVRSSRSNPSSLVRCWYLEFVLDELVEVPFSSRGASESKRFCDSVATVAIAISASDLLSFELLPGDTSSYTTCHNGAHRAMFLQILTTPKLTYRWRMIPEKIHQCVWPQGF